MDTLPEPYAIIPSRIVGNIDARLFIRVSSALQTLNLHAACADCRVAFRGRVTGLDWYTTHMELAKARKNENAKPLRPRDRINKMDRMRRRVKRSSFACLVPFLSILLSCPRFLVFVLRDAVERGCAILEFLSPRAVRKKAYRWFATYEEIATERKREEHFELLNFRIFSFRDSRVFRVNQ